MPGPVMYCVQIADSTVEAATMLACTRYLAKTKRDANTIWLYPGEPEPQLDPPLRVERWDPKETAKRGYVYAGRIEEEESGE